MNFLIVPFAVLVVICNLGGCKSRSSSTKSVSSSSQNSTSGKYSGVPKCEDLSFPDVHEVDPGQTNAGLMLNQNESCRVIGNEAIGGVLIAKDFSEQEASEIKRVETAVRTAYEEAKKKGTIREGYKWFSNWWQGVNEVCQAVSGTSPGADSGYKCIDKQGEIINGLLDLCRKRTFCLPKNMKIVEVTYNLGSPGEHHFLAVFLFRDKRPFYIGNIDPWANPNDPSISRATYNILQKGYDSYYKCGLSRIPKCTDDAVSAQVK